MAGQSKSIRVKKNGENNGGKVERDGKWMKYLQKLGMKKK